MRRKTPGFSHGGCVETDSKSFVLNEMLTEPMHKVRDLSSPYLNDIGEPKGSLFFFLTGLPPKPNHHAKKLMSAQKGAFRPPGFRKNDGRNLHDVC